MTYTFRNINTGGIVEIEMPISQYRHYKGEGGNEDCWERVYEAPQIKISRSSGKTNDPWSQKQFVENTRDMKGSVGDILDYSSEMSEKRAKESLTGEDPVKRRSFDEYSEKRGGKKHLKDYKKTIETSHFKVDLD